MTNQRQAFEKWISAPPYERDLERWPMDETKHAWPEQYKDVAVQLAWEAWQEAQQRQSGCAGSGGSETNMKTPYQDDLNTLAHELECDCNYPFAWLKDQNGELYSVKLQRLKEAVKDFDTILEEHRSMVSTIRFIRSIAEEAVNKATMNSTEFAALYRVLEIVEQCVLSGEFKSRP